MRGPGSTKVNYSAMRFVNFLMATLLVLSLFVVIRTGIVGPNQPFRVFPYLPLHLEEGDGTLTVLSATGSGYQRSFSMPVFFAYVLPVVLVLVWLVILSAKGQPSEGNARANEHHRRQHVD